MLIYIITVTQVALLNRFVNHLYYREFSVLSTIATGSQIYYTHVQYLPCDSRGATPKAALNARDMDRTSYLRHDAAIAYEMARAMTK